MSTLSGVQHRPINVYHRIQVRVGWIGLFSGESQGKALERAIRDLNERQYRVSFIIPDSLSFFGRLWNALLLAITLGWYSRSQNMLIVGERVEEVAQVGAMEIKREGVMG